jgi:hypothetical protein
MWNGSSYEHRILLGYEDMYIANYSECTSMIDHLASHDANFIRMWMRPSDIIDGHYAFYYNGSRRQVDLDTWDETWFDRLDAVLSYADSKGVVVEIMMWDQCTPWRGGGLDDPSEKNGWNDKNVHHPDNHYRSEHGNDPVPGLYMGDEDEINNSQFYDTSNSIWMDYQKEWTDKVLSVAVNHDHFTVEIINEAPGAGYATEWRHFMHDWLQSNYPVVSQSNGLSWYEDNDLRQWSENNPGKVDLVASHTAWGYDKAQNAYWDYKGVMPGVNECITVDYGNLNNLRQELWGVTMGGGAAWSENYPIGNGSTVTQEMHRFFYPPSDKPAFWEMRPYREYVTFGQDGHKYVLAKDDKSEILIFVDNEGGGEDFTVDHDGPKSYQYRTFDANGGSSSWSGWNAVSNWTFNVPDNTGVQIRADG